MNSLDSIKNPISMLQEKCQKEVNINFHKILQNNYKILT